MSDVGSRADDYENRLAAAGSTDALVGSLAENVDRNERMVKWLAAIMILVVTLSLAVGALSLVAWGNANTIDRNADKACHQANANTRTINRFLSDLIDNIETSAAYTPAEKLQRAEEYRESKRPLVDCT